MSSSNRHTREAEREQAWQALASRTPPAAAPPPASTPAPRAPSQPPEPELPRMTFVDLAERIARTENLTIEQAGLRAEQLVSNPRRHAAPPSPPPAQRELPPLTGLVGLAELVARTENVSIEAAAVKAERLISDANRKRLSLEQSQTELHSLARTLEAAGRSKAEAHVQALQIWQAGRSRPRSGHAA